MKHLLLFLIFTSFMISCENDSLKTPQNPPSETELKTSKELSFETNAEIAAEVYCKNNCDDSGDLCGLLVSTETVECNCEGCEMVIGKSNQKARENLFEVIKLTNLKKLKNNYNLSVINHISYESYKKAEVLFIEFLTNGKSTESIMYVFEKDKSGARVEDPIVIDCTGGCNNEGATCRERYLIGEGFECTCEGSCKMEVTEG